MRFRSLSRRLLPILAAGGVLAVSLSVIDLRNERAEDADRSAAVRRAGAEAVALQRQLDRALNAPIALAAYVQLNAGSIDGFEEFADRMIALVPSITNLQLAPDGVVTYIQPLAGNEAAIGHRLLDDRERTTEAFAAVESGKLTLAGPFELVQGGVAMVGRQPIYLPGAGNVDGLDPDFWGFATVLINLEDFFDASRIDELLDSGFQFEIAKFDRDQDAFVPFRSSGPTVDPVRVDISVANGTWQLAVGRDGGWRQSELDPLQIALAVLLAGATMLAVNRFQRRGDRLVAAVDQRTAELKHTNTALIRARDTAERANRAKTAFLSNVSHELRTPMNAIMGFAELIETDRLAAADRDAVGQIRSAGDHLLGLINEVLDITAIESGRLEIEVEPVDVAGLVARVHDLLTPLADDAGLSFSLHADPAVAVAHEGRLFQVVSNLVANAIRFTPSGGSVAVRTSMEGDACRIDVVDDGVGIAEEHVSRIFDPFERGDAPASVEGTGMGLAIVDRLVGAMRGLVTVESTVGAGSRFTVLLPGPCSPTDLIRPSEPIAAGRR